jgi:CDP-6-deoxy-D-xylo-4-hexulose-3-dehydrase
MDRVFWIGVYPGLTKEMLDFIAKVTLEFAGQAAAGLKTVP